MKNTINQKKKLIIANWKMNPDSEKSAKELALSIKKSASRLSGVDVVICPPYVFIGSIFSKSKVKIGAQDISFEDKGSHTGEVSATQVASLGANFVIIGHSERRKKGEAEGDIAKKVLKAVATGLTPIVCVGEDVHDEEGKYLEIVRAQILSALILLKKTEVWKVVIAYEPVWAIGATRAMSSYDLHQMSLYIRKVLADEYGKIAVGIPVIYGGSVDATNAAEIVYQGEVDGLLVGRESLSGENFGALLRAVNNKI